MYAISFACSTTTTKMLNNAESCISSSPVTPSHPRSGTISLTVAASNSVRPIPSLIFGGLVGAIGSWTPRPLFRCSIVDLHVLLTCFLVALVFGCRIAYVRFVYSGGSVSIDSSTNDATDAMNSGWGMDDTINRNHEKGSQNFSSDHTFPTNYVYYGAGERIVLAILLW